MREELGSIPGLGRSSGGGHGNPWQYSCLENPHGQRNQAGYSPWGCKESDTTEWLSTRWKWGLWTSVLAMVGMRSIWDADGEMSRRHRPRIHIEGWSQRYVFQSQEINDNSSCRSAWDLVNRHQTQGRGSKTEPWRTQHFKRAERQGWACKGGTDGCG